MINWRVRINNKWFWLALIPAVLLLVKSAAAVAGVELDFGQLGDRLSALIEAVFGLLAVLGIVVDPTTEGVQDSALAMTYQQPKPIAPEDRDGV